MIAFLLSRTGIKLLAGAVLAALFAYGVNTYNVWVSAKAVAKVEAEYAAKFNNITEQAKQLTRTINQNAVDARLAQAKAVAEQQEKANAATKKYQIELAKNKELAAERNQAITASGDLLVKLLNASTASVGNRPECPGLSRYANDLGERYASCERDLTEAIGEAAKAIDRASSAEAAVKALIKE
jgi:hypothetical protein